ncbi:MAG: R3H domain-containing nucleic acid-binding protein [Bacillota bacterium]|nr:R3H domain-containing nucleic acid-binding protein [Bacillota bacterium]
MTRREITDNLDELLEVLPPRIRDRLERLGDLNDLLEIVLDLGRQPEARFPGGKFVYLGDEPVKREDIEFLTKRVGAFGHDNRAGIERTLHRISGIRNRYGEIVGLTCRIGRAVYGTIDIVRDVVELGKSILLLGRPGVGKTTLLREVARVLSDEFNKRVVVVDTSNEIAGDGDIPHPAIGRARRMQVPASAQQADVMIEAVENHMPEVIVIDEIGTEAEAQAARTIAERGVQLVGTAHGNTLENLVLNPTLSDLVGGIQVVTLSDEEARKRGTQKTVLERKAPPTFDIVIEIKDRDSLAIHHDVARTVDLLLRGVEPRPEVRRRSGEGEIEVVQENGLAELLAREEGLIPREASGEAGLASAWVSRGPAGDREEGKERARRCKHEHGAEPGRLAGVAKAGGAAFSGAVDTSTGAGFGDLAAGRPPKVMRLYPYAVSRNRLEQAIRTTGLPVFISKDLSQADAVLTLKGQYRKMPKTLREAERRGLPVHIIRSNTITQISNFLRNAFSADRDAIEANALKEAEEALAKVVSMECPVELNPQNAYVRMLQHELAERNKVKSTSIGVEPFRRVVYYLDQSRKESM